MYLVTILNICPHVLGRTLLSYHYTRSAKTAKLDPTTRRGHRLLYLRRLGAIPMDATRHHARGTRILSTKPVNETQESILACPLQDIQKHSEIPIFFAKKLHFTG